MRLTVLNLKSARFECTFGRGCDGVCCRNGRPPLYPNEVRHLDRCADRVLPLLRPAARHVASSHGFVSRRRKAGQPMARVVDGWCVFFNRGCVLHRLGAEEGSPFRYKPAVCAMFPLAKDERDRWYVRQKGYKGEIWDLACLDPESSDVPAAASLREETALVATWETRGPGRDASEPGERATRTERAGEANERERVSLASGAGKGPRASQ